MKKTITRIEKYNVFIMLVAALASLALFRDYKISLSLVIGSVIGGANFWALTLIVKKMLEGSGSKLRLAAFVVLKFALLIFILWAVVKWLPLDIVAFLVGLSTIVAAILWTTLIS